MTRTNAIISIGLIVSACSATPEVNEDLAARAAAIEHARGNAELAEKSDALRQQGWSVTALEEANVELLNMPTEGSTTKWTRVTLDLAHGGAVNGKLSLAWNANGGDELAIAPANDAAEDEILGALSAAAPPDEEETDDDVGSVAQAASCRGEGTSCAAVAGTPGACCLGLGCLGPDNHEKCTCTHQWTAKFPLRGTVSIACFSLWGNPLGEAYYRRDWTGCDYNGSRAHAQGMCTTVTVPAYTKRINDAFVCHAGSPCFFNGG